MIRSEVYETYWRFAAERQAIYYRRLHDPEGPWTSDPILREYRFTNAFRASDRVSQYLIREVQYRSDRSSSPDEVFFRTILFKMFNRISTWERLERELGPISWQSASFEKIEKILDGVIQRGNRVYSAAYIMPSPAYGHLRKHANHLALLFNMMTDGLPARLAKVSDLKSAYELILSYPGIGPFLAFQYVIDLNYSCLLNFDEADFVVAGPGALDGMVKCFGRNALSRPEYVIRQMVESQEVEFARLGLEFSGLFGRPLQPIDCQNLFCEISKYARVAHPEVAGEANRKRIKQRYRADRGHAEAPFFPPKWGLKTGQKVKSRQVTQFELL